MRIRTALYLKILAAAALIALGAAVHAMSSAESRAGTASPGVSVIDGDTLQVNGRIVQLYGVDAPELGQSCKHDGVWEQCGLEAAFELSKLINMEHAPVECVSPKKGNPEAAQVCVVGHIDVASVLLEGGYAMATAETGVSYREAEEAARQSRLGLWHDDLVDPAAWRRGARLPGERDAETCPVKAVVTASGQRFYYVPTDAAYQSLTVEPPRGGQPFCSDEEARHAGWRREGEATGGTPPG